MNKSRLLTVSLLVVLILLAAGSWFAFGKGTGILFANADQYTSGDTEITSPVDALEIDWTSGEVRIEHHAGTGIIVSETADAALSEDQKLRWWLDGATLRISYMKPGINLSFNFRKVLTVSLPEGTVLKAADIRATSADLILPGLDADEIRIETTSGSVDASTAANRLTVSSTSGDLSIRQDSGLDSASFSATSGSISAALAGAREITADTSSGSIGISVSGSVKNIRLSSTSGRICPDLSYAEKAEFSSTSGGVSGKVASFSDLKIRSTAGSVTLQLSAEPGFTCETDTASGDFSSDLALTKDKDTYACGDGKAKCRIETTSGDIRIERIR